MLCPIVSSVKIDFNLNRFSISSYNIALRPPSFYVINLPSTVVAIASQNTLGIAHITVARWQHQISRNREIQPVVTTRLARFHLPIKANGKCMVALIEGLANITIGII